jgi:hypothetical protein
VGAERPQHSNTTLGTARLLEHFAGLARVADGRRVSARARLESELGDDFADLLVAALVHEGEEERRFDAFSR